MALTAPTVTLAAGSTAFTLISVEGQKSTYRSADGLNEIIVSHQEGKRNRRTIRLNRTETTSDPFIPAQNVEVTYSAYLVVDMPKAGYAMADVDDDVSGLNDWINSSTVLSQFLNGES